jgi:hypothetical protein
MRRNVPYISVLYILLVVICGYARQIQATPLINGDFETGDLTGWSVFTNEGVSELGDGFPQVALFDINGNGVKTFSAVFRVGGGGGGLFQRVDVLAGDLTITLDIATFAPDSNVSGGLFEVFVDGREVATHDFGFINGGSTKRVSLTGTTPVTAGTHEIVINMSRSNFQSGSSTPLQYIDNVVLSGRAAPPPCTLNLTGSATNGTLTLDFDVGTHEPATWNVWLIAQAECMEFLSAALPRVDPPSPVHVSIPSFPSLGTIGILTTLTTPDQGIICSAFKTVNTGSPTQESAPIVHELSNLFLQHAVGLQELFK